MGIVATCAAVIGVVATGVAAMGVAATGVATTRYSYLHILKKNNY